MSATKLSLLKDQTAKVKLSLLKRNVLTAPIVRVGQALDISGSMTPAYRSGDVAKIVFRTLALANTFDDNGEMDMWAFNQRSFPLASATPDNFDTFVDDEIVHGVSVGGGTTYSPCLSAISEFYFPKKGFVASAPVKVAQGFMSKLFGKKAEAVTPEAPVVDPTTIPALAIFLTDGENDGNDLAKAEAVFRDSQKSAIYWLLMGVGHSNFTFLEEMADKYPNVGFVSFEHLDMSDEELYDGVISQEFIDWVTP